MLTFTKSTVTGLVVYPINAFAFRNFHNFAIGRKSFRSELGTFLTLISRLKFESWMFFWTSMERIHIPLFGSPITFKKKNLWMGISGVYLFSWRVFVCIYIYTETGCRWRCATRRLRCASQVLDAFKINACEHVHAWYTMWCHSCTCPQVRCFFQGFKKAYRQTANVQDPFPYLNFWQTRISVVWPWMVKSWIGCGSLVTA